MQERHKPFYAVLKQKRPTEAPCVGRITCTIRKEKRLFLPYPYQFAINKIAMTQCHTLTWQTKIENAKYVEFL